MKLAKRNVLILFRLLSSAFLGIMIFTYFQVMNFDYNNKSQIIRNLEKKLEKNNICLNYFENEVFWDIDKITKCNLIKSEFGIFYDVSEDSYLYYSFAIILGAVVNVNKIMKIGIF